ncbi:MAG: hypothetical protein BWY69_00280 [Planctomycetes bacterium ADurb.Bin401]|nr:MAG: hypothetical protein BWY69_00280 [Planctomycetes bacterium ADurb.Bin401]
MDINNNDNSNQNIPSSNATVLEPPPLPSNQTTSGEYFRKLLSLTGGSLFYCLSAFAIIYGVAQTIGPLLADGKNLKEALMCVVTLNIYELSLLAVLVVIVVFRNVTDDAISLIVIAALFLITSGATLGTAGYREPRICLYIGLICSVLGFAKLLVLKKNIKIKIGVVSFAGITLVLLWNFLTGTLMSDFLLSGTANPEKMQERWIAGWCVFLSGILLTFLESAGVSQSKIDENNNRNVFLHRYSMARLFAILLFAAGCAHIYGMAYMFSIKHYLGDYLPFTVMISLMIYEFVRSLKKPQPELELFILCIPACFFIVALADSQIKTGWGLNLNILWYPPILAGITGAVIFTLGIKNKSDCLKYVSAVYVLLALLTVKYSPARPEELNWKFAGVFIVTALLLLGIIKKNIALCVLSIFILSFGLLSMNSLESISKRFGLTVGGTMAICCGSGLLALCIGFGKKSPQILSLFASFVLMLGLFDFILANSSWVLFPIAMVVIVTGVIVLLRTRHIAPLIILLIPFCYKMYGIGRSLSNWRAIIAGFLFLFIGAFFSYIKGKKSEKLINQGNGTNPLMNQGAK